MVKPDFDPAPGALRVLIADDDQHVREAVRHHLEAGSGIVVTGAVASGTLALQHLACVWADVVVLDLRMPYGGVDLVQRIHSDHPRCCVVVFSADASLRGAALTMGADAFVQKGDPDLDLTAVVVGAAVRRARRTRDHPRADDAAP